MDIREVPDYRTRIGNYPRGSLLAIYLPAVLCEAPRGSKDLYKFARKLSQAQRRALGIRQRQGRYPAPSQPTFWRMLEEVNGTQLEGVLRQVQEHGRGDAAQHLQRVAIVVRIFQPGNNGLGRADLPRKLGLRKLGLRA